MPPKKASASAGGARRGRPTKAATAKSTHGASRSSAQPSQSPDPFASSEDEHPARHQARNSEDDIQALSSEEEEPAPRRRPPKAKGKSMTRTGSGRSNAVNIEGEDEEDDDMDIDGDLTTASARSGARGGVVEGEAEREEEDPPEKSIPPELLARLLHEGFQKEGTRMTGDAAKAAAKYVDVFVREAIARCAQEREGGFLDVSSSGGCEGAQGHWLN